MTTAITMMFTNLKLQAAGCGPTCSFTMRMAGRTVLPLNVPAT